MQAAEFQFQVGYGESVSVINYLDKDNWLPLKRLVRLGMVEGKGASRVLSLGESYATFAYLDGSWRWKSYHV
jgi:hypothetical protein